MQGLVALTGGNHLIKKANIRRRKITKNPEIAILIPCYNESLTVKKVVEDYRREFPEAIVYVYDNNSTDGTDKLAKEAGAVVRYCYQQGKGNVVRKMFSEIEADCYIMADGDDTNPPCREMADLILDGKADMVIGDRLSSTYFSENQRPFHNDGNRIVRMLINELFSVDYHDIMSGSRAFSYQFVKTYPVLSKGFEVETEMSIHAASHNLLVAQIPIDYRDRPEGSYSKLNTYTDGAKVLKTVFLLFKDYCPMTFFGILSMFFFLLASFNVIPVVNEWEITRMVRRFPTLIVCCFVYLASFLSFFSGMILSSISKKEKIDFEKEWKYRGKRV